MSLEHIKDAALVLYKANIPLFVFGGHGIGKTSAIYQLFVKLLADLGHDFNDLVDQTSLQSRVKNPEAVVLKKDLRSISSLDGKYLARQYGDKKSFKFWSMSAPNISIEEIIGMPHVEDLGAVFRDAYLRTLDVAARIMSRPKANETDDVAVDGLFALHKPIFDRVCKDLGLTEDDKGRLMLRYLRIYGLMPEPDHNGGGIWLIDELNRGFIEVEKAFMQILLERRYLDYVVPEDVWIVTTMNPSAAGYKVREMDPAVLDRAAVLTVKSDKPGFMNYAQKRGLSDATRAFADKQEKLINTHEADLDLDMPVKATYRSMEMNDKAWEVMTPYEIKDVGLTVTSSLLGREAATLFYKLATERVVRPLTLSDVVDGYGWNDDMSVDEERDWEKWKVSKARTKLKAQVKKANVKTELINVTLGDLREWFHELDKSLEERKSTRENPQHTKEEKGKLLNCLLFLADLPADIARKFLMEDLDGIYDRTLFWAGTYPLTRHVYRRIQQDYEKAEKGGS